MKLERANSHIFNYITIISVFLSLILYYAELLTIFMVILEN